MKKLIIASMREDAGKTSLITGLMAALDKPAGYIKPFGDRLIYRRKRNLDYDASLMIDIFDLKEDPETITIGFDHSKLRYVYDSESIKVKLEDISEKAGSGNDLLFVEGGQDISYGTSINLDSLNLARYLDGELIIVLSGSSDAIFDDARFLKNNLPMKDVNFAGVIINKVRDIDEFEDVYLGKIKDLGINVLGIVPYKKQLTYYSISYLAQRLYAKVIAGNEGIHKIVKNIFVGAMSTDESMRNPLFNRENKFLITSGDRSDMIIAALESDTVGILLTNNILPPSNIISMADEKNIPLLLVTMDTYEATKQVDTMTALLTPDNDDRIKLLAQMTKKYIEIDKILS